MNKNREDNQATMDEQELATVQGGLSISQVIHHLVQDPSLKDIERLREEVKRLEAKRTGKPYFPPIVVRPLGWT